MGAERLAHATAFARAARGYWLSVFPLVSRELHHWRERAQEIPDRELRALALRALSERGNMEGAAAFATFVPRPHRAAVVRATIAFQAAYNHLDVLSEQPHAHAFEHAERLHGALLDALRPAGDAYPQVADGGYVAALVHECRSALAQLPSYPVVAPLALQAAERVVAFQAHQAGREPVADGGDTDVLDADGCDADRGGEDAQIARWARAIAPLGADLRWWEAAAAAGSSLGVHATIALAAEPRATRADAQALAGAYFPWICALHSLLDHLIDAGEDARDGQRNLIERYPSREHAAQRMALLAKRSLAAARALPAHAGLRGPAAARLARRHELVVAAMASFYLAAPQARAGEAEVVSRAVLGAFGGSVRPALAVFRVRRGVERVARVPARAGAGSARAGAHAKMSAAVTASVPAGVRETRSLAHTP